MKLKYMFGLLAITTVLSACAPTIYDCIDEEKMKFDEDKMKELVEKDKVDINKTKKDIKPFITLFNDTKTVQYLIDHGADVNIKTVEGISALHFVAGDKPAEVVDFFIKNGADIKARDEANNTALIWAAQATKDPKVITTLIKAGADVNERGVQNQTPLMFAATFNNDVKILKTLLKNGAKVNLEDDNKYTALRFAITHKKADNVKALLEAGAKVELVYLLASDNKKINNPENVRLAIKNGADVNARLPNDDGDTPLTLAVCSDFFDIEMVKTLIQNGADPKKGDKNGYLAENCADSEKVKYIKDYVKNAKKQKINDELKSLEEDKLF